VLLFTCLIKLIVSSQFWEFRSDKTYSFNNDVKVTLNFAGFRAEWSQFSWDEKLCSYSSWPTAYIIFPFKNCLLPERMVANFAKNVESQEKQLLLEKIKLHSYSKSQITSRMNLKKTWIKRETWITFQIVCWIKLTYAFMNTIQNKTFFQEMTKDVSYSTSDVLPE